MDTVSGPRVPRRATRRAQQVSTCAGDMKSKGMVLTQEDIKNYVVQHSSRRMAAHHYLFMSTDAAKFEYECSLSVQCHLFCYW